MDSLLIQNRLHSPITTGAPGVDRNIPAQRKEAAQEGPSFQQVLEAQVAQGQTLSFSKHAASRVEEREIDLSGGGMERLDEGVRIARTKGLDDALIIMGGSAFIVNAKSGTVITAMNGNELKGKAITNIDGTVII